MKIKVIKTGFEYAAALARVEKLMDAKPGTSSGDELEILSLLVHDYEERVFPIAKPDPVAAIRFRMTQQGLTNKDLVPFFGQSKPGFRDSLRAPKPQPQNDPCLGRRFAHSG